MTTERDETDGGSPRSVAGPSGPAGISRRLLMRGAAAAVPTILTLNSPLAAATARTSNVISLNYDAPADGLDRKLCVDLSTSPAPVNIEGNRYDLGEPPTVGVSPIPVKNADGTTRVYRLDSKQSAAQVYPADMCRNGGTFYYQAPTGVGNSMEWRSINVRGGMMASAGALASFGTSVNIYNV